MPYNIANNNETHRVVSGGSDEDADGPGPPGAQKIAAIFPPASKNHNCNCR